MAIYKLPYFVVSHRNLWREMILSSEKTCWHDYEVPKWILQIINLGYTWEKDRNPWKRRICLISMPCQSVAAPLLALGALRRDLERINANNYDGHFDALCRARDIYVENINISGGYVIDSKNKKWKFSSDMGNSNGIVVTDTRHKEFVKRNGKLIENLNMPCKSLITKDNAKYWRLDGYSVVEADKADQKLSKNDYLVIPECDGSIDDMNLGRSYSGLLLVGDGEGHDTNYMQEIYKVTFYRNGQQVSLGKLLTLHPHKNGVARMAFCNHQKVDLQSNDHYLVVADGASAFLKSLSHFKMSDVIGVYSRDEPVENLAVISGKLGEISRYYEVFDNYPSFENKHPFIATRLMQRR
jgi:hypothetical protein